MGDPPSPVTDDGDRKLVANSFLSSGRRSREEEETFTDELKRTGMPVLLHVKVGKLEPASIKLDEETGTLVIKTDREGWCSWCNCLSKRYEIGPAQLEPTDTRTCTSKLNRSISLVNSGDAYLNERMLMRSVSLLRRHPEPESIDLTFSTQDEEERFRLWVQKRLSVSAGHTRHESSRSVMKALQGLCPSDNSDDDTAYSEDQPTPKKPPRMRAVVGSAAVRSVQRRSLKQRRSQSERWDRHRTLSGSSSRGQKVQAIPEKSVAGGSGSGGGGAGAGGAFDESLKAMWSWKEPPVLRKTDSSSTSSYSKSRSSRGGAGKNQGVDESPRGGDSSDSRLPRRGSEPPMSRALTFDDALHYTERRRVSGSDIGADFWDPLGLMSDVTSATPPAKKHVPERGSRRDISLVSAGGGDAGDIIAADSPPLGVGGAEKGGEVASAAAGASSSPPDSLGTSSRHSTKETTLPTGLPEISE